MKILESVSANDVWEQWFKTEHKREYDALSIEARDAAIGRMRTDIRDPLPRDVQWFMGELDAADTHQLHIISSDDWRCISAGTFRVAEVAAGLNVPYQDKDSIRISHKLKNLLQHLVDGGKVETTLVAVSDSMGGPYTIIEGNHRAVCLCCLDRLPGTKLHVGVSPAMRGYLWARHTYGR